MEKNALLHSWYSRTPRFLLIITLAGTSTPKMNDWPKPTDLLSPAGEESSHKDSYQPEKTNDPAQDR